MGRFEASSPALVVRGINVTVKSNSRRQGKATDPWDGPLLGKPLKGNSWRAAYLNLISYNRSPRVGGRAARVASSDSITAGIIHHRPRRGP